MSEFYTILSRSVLGLSKTVGKFVIPTLLVSGVLLITPIKYLEYINLADTTTTYKPIIGVVFLVSLVLFIAWLSNLVGNKMKVARNLQESQSRVKYIVSTFSFNEQMVLREFFLQGSNVIAAPMSNEAVLSLKNKGVITEAESFSLVGFDLVVKYLLVPAFENVLKLEHVDLPAPKAVDGNVDLQNKIQNERPHWVQNYSLSRGA